MFGNRAYNPYQMYPVARKSFDWGNLLNNTQKTLSIINQTIPIVYQLKPIVSNAKTMLRIFDAVRETDQPKTSTSRIQEEASSEENLTANFGQPSFFL